MSLLEPTSVVLRDGRTVLLRHGVPADAPALLSFLEAVLGESDHLLLEPGEMRLTVQQEVDWVRMHLDDPGSVLLVAEAGGQLVGLGEIARGGRRRIAHQGELAMSLRASWRGAGLGSAMMEVLLGWAEANPLLEKVCLSVFAENAHARALYQRFGFVEEGCRPRQLKRGPGRYSDEVLMSRFVEAR